MKKEKKMPKCRRLSEQSPKYHLFPTFSLVSKALQNMVRCSYDDLIANTNSHGIQYDALTE